jgi:uncharacterized protein YggE
MKHLFATVSVLALMAMPAMAQEKIWDKVETKLDIAAQASIKSEPDMAVISAGVVTNAKTADAALKENANKMAAVFAALKKSGIKDKDIQTSGINVSPQYVYEEKKAPAITGYQASNNVNVAIHDLKIVGSVLDTLVSQGANQINGPTFSIEDTDDLMDQARKDAMVKARKRAELYAAASGLKIKRILSISEQGGYNPPGPVPMFAMAKAMRADAAQESSPVSAGQVDVNVTVNVAYELGQ